MFDVLSGQAGRMCDGLTRRSFMRVGTLAALGAGAGAALGAIIGHQSGEAGAGAAIGAAVGGGTGYIVGNESDKKKANRYNPNYDY